MHWAFGAVHVPQLKKKVILSIIIIIGTQQPPGPTHISSTLLKENIMESHSVHSTDSLFKNEFER